MRMGIGLGVGINRSNYAQGIFNAYSARVVADGGVVESGTCVDAVSSLLQSASLLLIPSGYKGGKAYAEIPTNGNGDLTWTRGSDAFRTNASGVLQRVPWNLAPNSENFSALYSGINATISNNTTSAPNATTTADSLLETTATDIHAIYADYTQPSGVQYTYSVYVKSISGRNVRISGSSGFSGPIALVDLSNGTLLSGSTGASVESVGNGWYRISITATTTTTQVRVLIYSMNGTATTFAGSTSNGVYVWGAQLVEGTTAQTYLPTTDRLGFARLDYMYGSCPAVLLEPQRTNTMLYSQAINSWAAKTELTITDNYATSPDGTQNASYIQQTTGGNAITLQSQNINITTGQAQTVTFYAKAKEVTSITLRLATATLWSGGVRPTFTCDLLTGSISVGIGTATVSSQNVGNGWYRFIISTPATIASGVSSLQTLTGAILSPTSGDGFYLWGVQWEQNAAYPTTYIPTTSATATRVADSFSRNNIFTNGLISASGGTWFVEFRNNIAYRGDAAGDGIFLRTVGDTDNFRFYSDNSSTNRIYIFKRVSNVNTQLYLTATDIVKIAIKWNGSTADIFVNGTKVISATSFTATQLQEITTSISAVPKFIQQMALFPTPLSDTDCATLTT